MRTQKRFTPALLERYVRVGRGTGTYQNYIPWHRVSRSDPSSMGRSHLMVWKERQRELLSDGEWVGMLFATMLSNLEDVREQHPLAKDSGGFELADYDVRFAGQSFPGTTAIAAQLGIRHPRVNDDGRSELWTMSTDQVLVLMNPSGQLELLAVAYKPTKTGLTKRDKEKLEIEKAYWTARGVQWLLISAESFEKSVGLSLRRYAPWGLGTAVSPEEISSAVEITRQTIGRSFTFVLDSLTVQLGDHDLAQRAFWQAVWYGHLPLDLRIGWRPHLPVQLLNPDEFKELNPIASRRTSWI
jgi:hypothetical protein